MAMWYQYDDGGRGATSSKENASERAVRAIAIATGKLYQEVYDAITALAAPKRNAIQVSPQSSARGGINSATIRKYLESLGWTWKQTMLDDQGCTVHLVANDLPAGRLIVRLSKHLVAVIDGVVHDVYVHQRKHVSCRKEGELQVASSGHCVYGYWMKEDADGGTSNR
jgi:hypothetical protein